MEINMYTIDETEAMLDEIAEEMPQEFYQELSGGIVLREEVKLHPKNKVNDLYILGEYHRDSRLGNYIAIYYGSVIRNFGNFSLENYKAELRKLLKHEFRHHLEGMAGEKDLEVEDAIDLQKYLKE